MDGNRRFRIRHATRPALIPFCTACSSLAAGYPSPRIASAHASAHSVCPRRHSFQGNPAALRLLDSPVSDRQMRSVATEPSRSETSFLLGDPCAGSLHSQDHAPRSCPPVSSIRGGGDRAARIDARAAGRLPRIAAPAAMSPWISPVKDVPSAAVPPGTGKGTRGAGCAGREKQL
ncbi:PhzF family phenazine biosynthesis protein [Nonomuraea basaltis]|nr:PhzF family phenazine biosynthesis protein [Nonomuraea basaltis]